MWSVLKDKETLQHLFLLDPDQIKSQGVHRLVSLPESYMNEDVKKFLTTPLTVGDFLVEVIASWISDKFRLFCNMINLFEQQLSLRLKPVI